jgi:hypothetical protein
MAIGCGALDFGWTHQGVKRLPGLPNLLSTVLALGITLTSQFITSWRRCLSSCFIYAAGLAADDPAATIGLHALSPAQRTGSFEAVKRIEGALVPAGDSLISEHTSHTLLFRYRTLEICSCCS